MKLEESEDVREEAVKIRLRKSISYYSTIQAHDGHWPAESAGPLFFLPPLVIINYYIYYFFINIYYLGPIKSHFRDKNILLVFVCFMFFLLF